MAAPSAGSSGGSGSGSAFSPLPAAPAELKSLTPYLQRSNELIKPDAVMSYWCLYYSAQLGIGAKAKERESKMYLLTLMDRLEALKTALDGNDAVTSDEAGSAYIENFALRVFVGADNEDREGRADRNTARRFLAASCFFEVLGIFGTVPDEITEKKTYAKWKASEISKAIKEGRKPAPGPPGWDPEEDQRQRAAEAAAEAEAREAIREAGDDDELVARELQRLEMLTAPNTVGGGSETTSRETDNGAADEGLPDFPSHPVLPPGQKMHPEGPPQAFDPGMASGDVNAASGASDYGFPSASTSTSKAADSLDAPPQSSALSLPPSSPSLPPPGSPRPGEVTSPGRPLPQPPSRAPSGVFAPLDSPAIAAPDSVTAAGAGSDEPLPPSAPAPTFDEPSAPLSPPSGPPVIPSAPPLFNPSALPPHQSPTPPAAAVPPTVSAPSRPPAPTPSAAPAAPLPAAISAPHPPSTSSLPLP